MAPAFIFAEQVRSIVKSGKKEIEIPEGARISSAAADLIKEHQIQIKTVAPGIAASDEISAPKANRKKHADPSAQKAKTDPQFENSAEITEEELEEIVNRIVKRFKQLKDGEAQREDKKKADTAVKKKDQSYDRCL